MTDQPVPLSPYYEPGRADFHKLIVERIYHEDNLFGQRTYVLLAVHAFLLTALSVLITAQQATNLTWATTTALSSFGAVLGVFQASFGRQTGCAIHFWRQYAHLIEATWAIPYDHLQYDYYIGSRVQTPFGPIGRRGENQKALYQAFRRLGVITSITTAIGVVFPAALALFWDCFLGYSLWKCSDSLPTQPIYRLAMAIVAPAVVLAAGLYILTRPLAVAQTTASAQGTKVID